MSKTVAPLLIALAVSHATACSKPAGDAPTLATAAASSSAAPAPAASAEAVDPTPSYIGQGPSVVDLHGDAHPPAPPRDDAPRLASIAMHTDVHLKPSATSPRVGELRAGAIVAMDPDSAGTAGCPKGWRKIEPFGYVCIGAEATLDLDNPIVRASTRRPDVTQKLPYMYGIAVRGGPAYAKIPTAEEQKREEPHLAKHIDKWKRDKESGATYGNELWLKWRGENGAPSALDALRDRTSDTAIPWFLSDGQRAPNLSGLIKQDTVRTDEFSHHNGVAFIDSFLVEGRRFGVATDLRVLPADRFRPIRGSDFHGFEIGKDVDFPFALVRRRGARKWLFEGTRKDGGPLEWRSAVGLTGKQRFFDGKLHYETKDGFWVDDQHAGRVDPAKKMPAWGKNGEKWIDVNITKQVLVAYEGTKPVFTTLISSGEAGLGDPETTKATKRGIFRIHTKYISVTMDSSVVGEAYELRDVPYVQYFENGYALHGSYWHDMFGQPKSHGCVNLSPEDARRLFFWTEPQLPPGWHGIAKPLTGTVVFIHP